MATKKTPSTKKPTLDKTLKFAKGKKTASKSGLVPEGDRRLVCNVRSDLHKKLRHAAIEKETTVGEIIEVMIEKYLK